MTAPHAMDPKTARKLAPLIHKLVFHLPWLPSKRQLTRRLGTGRSRPAQAQASSRRSLTSCLLPAPSLLLPNFLSLKFMETDQD